MKHMSELIEAVRREWLDPHVGAQGLESLFEASLFDERQGLAVQRPVEFGIQFERALKGGECRVVLLILLQKKAQVEMHIGLRRVDVDRLPEQGARLITTSRRRVQAGNGCKHSRIERPQGEDALPVFEGHLALTKEGRPGRHLSEDPDLERAHRSPASCASTTCQNLSATHAQNNTKNATAGTC